MIYFTSDLHINHKNIIPYSKRPFASVEEMNPVIIDNINKTVGENDTLKILGDFLMGPHKFENFKLFYSQIKCKNIHLLKGNHDNWMDRYRNEVVDFLGYFPIGYDEIRIGPKLIVMCHYPIASWNEQNKKSWQVYGHCHHTFPINMNAKRMDVGVDAWYPELGQSTPEYRPFSLDDIETVMENRRVEQVDHHA